MPHDHPIEELLVDYAEAPASLAEREEIEAHLAECAECAGVVEELRLVTAEMRNPEVWAALADLEDERGVQAELSLFEQRLAREDIQASRLLAEAVSTPFRFQVSKLVEKPALITGGVVRLLSKRAHDEADNEPLFALNLAEAATILAERLPDDYYPAEGVYELRGTAWKEYSTACRFLGRYPEALDALKRAERAYRHLLEPTVSLATIDLARAIVLWRMEQYDRALAAAMTAAQSFARSGDTERYMSSKEVEAVILHRKGDFTAARAAYLSVYEAGSSTGDSNAMQRAAQNLGTFFIERGDVGEASRYFLEALQLAEGMGLKARAVRARWCIGWVALVAGDFAQAERRLRASDLEIRALGMIDDADNVKLHLAEALLMLGRFDEVERLAADLVTAFRSAELVTGALTAAAFLREAASARTLTRRQVQQVRRYLERLKEEPALLFTPPPPAE